MNHTSAPVLRMRVETLAKLVADDRLVKLATLHLGVARQEQLIEPVRFLPGRAACLEPCPVP